MANRVRQHTRQCLFCQVMRVLIALTWGLGAVAMLVWLFQIAGW